MTERECTPVNGIDDARACVEFEDGASGIPRRLQFVVHGDPKCIECKRGLSRPSGIFTQLCRFLAGEGPLDVDGDLRRRLIQNSTSPFARDVFSELMNVAPGSTITYGALAEASGHPGAARAVGTVMRRNKHPILLPCHRVVAKSGPGGFAGNQHPVLARVKTRLQEIERETLNGERK